MSSRPPLIGVVSDRRIIEPHPFHVVGEKYSRALVDAADAYPVGLPAFADEFDVLQILDRLDGLLLTGSPSNVAPQRYHGPASAAGSLHDLARDQASFALIPAALRLGLPLLAICRGCQELNVALGGSLHQAVHSVPGYNIHHEDPDQPLEVQYGPAHSVSFTRGGLLIELTGRRTAIVNSVHHQGIDQLADGLAVEATAEDGLIEAVTVRDAAGFVLGVQWHPEWRVTEDPVSAAIFQAFGEACVEYRR
jgi:putative glutamine amidotransferase